MKSRQVHGAALLALFAVSFAASRWVYDYVLLLQYQTPASFFVFDGQFLGQWLERPGGPLAGADRFLRQFFHSEWLGALAIAATTTALGILLYLLRRKRGEEIGIFHTLAPCLALLALGIQGPSILGLLVSCGAYVVYLHLPGGPSRWTYAVLVTPWLYFAAGGFSWFFVLWVVATGWRAPRSIGALAPRIAYAALSVALPLLAYRWLFAISMEDAWLGPLRLPQTAADGLLLLYLLSIPLWPGLATGERLRGFWRSRRGVAAQAALLLCLSAGLVLLSYDLSARRLADYHRLYEQRDWDGILDRARTHRLADGMSQFFTNYALYQKGRLLDEMFAYPQDWGTLGLLPTIADHAAYGRRAMYHSDLYLEMGHVNAAYKLAYNHVYVWGETYANLRRVAVCAMANGNYELAKKYLRRLARTLHHRDFAQRYMQLLADRDATDRHFAELRAKRPQVELEIGLGEFACLLALVKSRPDNRMAHDYLTAWCLLDKGALPIVAEHLDRLPAAGYDALPAHCQEALMLWEATTRTRVDRGGLPLDAAVAKRFGRFGQLMRQSGGKQAAEYALRATFGDTYTYYYLFSDTPAEPTAWSSWMMLGHELLARGEVDEAITYYRQAELRLPGSAVVQAHMGRALALAGRSAEARARFDQARAAAADTAAATEPGPRVWQMGTH